MISKNAQNVKTVYYVKN